MSIILWIVLGGVAGWIASLIMKTRGGILMDIIVGIVGSVIGGFAMSLVGATPASGFSVYSLIVAVIGAVILLAIVKAISGRRVGSTAM
jgi:uncharacterized membrane protein YeaQ/YmgE (transglycosylase-associated protein family)